LGIKPAAVSSSPIFITVVPVIATSIIRYILSIRVPAGIDHRAKEVVPIAKGASGLVPEAVVFPPLARKITC
jgi:hypothetical protein